MKKAIKIALIFLFPFVVKGQTTYLLNNNTSVTITCASTNLFYDSGNLAGNYNNNESFTKTFVAPPGFCLSVNFGDFNSQGCCDILDIHNGPNTGSPLLVSLAGNLGAVGPYYASGSSLTFDFTSNGTTNRPGWEATITCQAICTGTPAGGTITNVSPTCPSTGSIQLSVLNSGFGCGISYQWQSAPAMVGPWSNVAGATSQTLTVPLSTTFYRRITTCGVNSGTSTSMSSTSVITSGCDLSTYAAVPIPYSFDNFVGTTTPSTDDVLFSTIVNFGFPVCYAGSQYWGGYIASNTSFVLDAVPCYPNIQSTTYAAGGAATGYIIGSAAPVNGTSIPRNAILGPWHDADPSVGGTIRYTTLGTAPNRRFVVSFESIPMYNCASSAAVNFTGQIKLFETTGNIEIHIGNKALCAWNGQDAILGLHNFNGSVYVPPVNATAHNYPTNWTMTNTAYRFTSPCAGVGGPCVTLPVNFKSFKGKQVDDINTLRWETSQEDNIKEFIVERSTDAVNFTDLGKMLPYNKPSAYDFNDLSFKPGITNYYRVTALEFTGARKSTFVLPIGDNIGDINVSEIFPNPAKDNFTVSLSTKQAMQVQVTVKDLYGITVKTLVRPVDIGTSQLFINCSDLSPAVYFVEVSDLTQSKVISQQKLVIIN